MAFMKVVREGNAFGILTLRRKKRMMDPILHHFVGQHVNLVEVRLPKVQDLRSQLAADKFERELADFTANLYLAGKLSIEIPR
jgi:hypothetical protein